MDNENTISNPIAEKARVVKKNIFKIIIGVVLFSLVALPIYVIGAAWGFFPNKAEAKDSAIHRVTNLADVYYDADVSDIKIKSCKHDSFVKESKDDYGFFDYAINNSITVGDSGKVYTNYKDYFKDEFGVDIYTARKHVYTVKGTCIVSDSFGSRSEKNFTIIIVQVSGTNFRMSINNGNIFTEKMGIEEIAENDVIAYAKLSYEAVKTCRVKITDKAQSGNEITVYGKVYITDRYGDSYTSRFNVTYENVNGVKYQKKSIDMSTPYKDN